MTTTAAGRRVNKPVSRTATKPAARRSVAAKAAGSRRSATSLSHERIAVAALQLIDRDGLEAFSTRKLGKELRCEAMAIYWYYPSKDALLDAVVEQLVIPIGLGVATAPPAWVDALRGVAHAYRRIAHDHPRAFPLLATRRFATAGSYGFLEDLFALGRRHGIADDVAARFYRVVSSYCNGFGLNELAARREQDDPTIAAERARFAHVDAVFSWLGPEHVDETFSFGLELLLDALARTGGSGPAGSESRR